MEAGEARQDVDNLSRADATRDLDRQVLARPLIDDRQALELLGVGAVVIDEIVRPDVVGRDGWRRARSARGDPPPWPAPRYLRFSLAPQSVGAVNAHFKPLAGKKHPDRTIAVSRILPGERSHCYENGCVLLRQPRFIVQGRARDREQSASAPLRHASIPRIDHLTSSHRLAHNSFTDLLNHVDLEIPFSPHPLQARVLLLEFTQPAHVSNV